MGMKNWNELPQYMQNSKVREYYDILATKTGSLVVKRIFDIVISLIMLFILSPVFIVLAIMIKFDSKGPVMFRQVRVTRYGRTFRIFKFRTMVNNAEKKGSLVTTNGDSRVTNVGKHIRKLRLDEIPQLINVLLGDMTFVGTRPEVVKYVECYSEEMCATLLLPAGITSWASIAYKDEDKLLENAEDADRVYVHEVLPAKMEYNLESIRKFSFLRELKTMISTVVAVLH